MARQHALDVLALDVGERPRVAIGGIGRRWLARTAPARPPVAPGLVGRRCAPRRGSSRGARIAAGRSAGRITGPSATATACSIAFSSSRTLPG